TTMIYTHVLNRGGMGVRSPGDALGGGPAASGFPPQSATHRLGNESLSPGGDWGRVQSELGRMPDTFTIRLPERDDVSMAARMTNIQFSALAQRLARTRVVAETRALLARRRPTRGRLTDPAEVTQWLL